MQELQNSIAEKYCSGIPMYESEQVAPALLSALKENMKPALGSLCLILGLVFVSALMKAFSDAVSPDGASVDLCVRLLCSISVGEALRQSFLAVRLSLSGIAVLMDTMSAGMCMLYGLTGNVAGGSASVSVIMLVLQTVRLLSDRILMPLILACFGAALLSGLGFDNGLSSVCGVVRSAVVFLCAVCAAVVCGVLAYQTVIAKAADTAAMRTVRFVSSSFIPIIGGSLSESAAAVSTAISAVKASAGAGGAVSLCILTVPAALFVISSKLCMRISSFSSSLLGTQSLKTFFDDCNGILSILLSVTLTVSVIFTVACALFCI